MKPLLFGYLNVRIGAPRGTLASGEQALKEYAVREGYCLEIVFVERNCNRPMSALVALIEAANRQDVRVVAVPTRSDLGSMPRVRQLTERMLEREARVRVIVLEAAA